MQPSSFLIFVVLLPMAGSWPRRWCTHPSNMTRRRASFCSELYDPSICHFHCPFLGLLCECSGGGTNAGALLTLHSANRGSVFGIGCWESSWLLTVRHSLFLPLSHEQASGVFLPPPCTPRQHPAEQVTGWCSPAGLVTFLCLVIRIQLPNLLCFTRQGFSDCWEINGPNGLLCLSWEKRESSERIFLTHLYIYVLFLFS